MNRCTYLEILHRHGPWQLREPHWIARSRSKDPIFWYFTIAGNSCMAS